MLFYLMGQEAKLDNDKLEANFRTMIFANDPSLYYEMFDKGDQRTRQQIEEEVEWIVPESEEEIEALLAQLPPIPE